MKKTPAAPLRHTLLGATNNEQGITIANEKQANARLTSSFDIPCWMLDIRFYAYIIFNPRMNSF